MAKTTKIVRSTRVDVKEDAVLSNLSQHQRRSLEFTSYGTDPWMAEDMYRFFCGHVLGYGQYRTVFNYNPGGPADDATRVIKVAENDTSANILEWQVWSMCHNDNLPLKKWLAPCVAMSPNGHFLIQEKCRPATLNDKLHKEVPQFFTDLKVENWGWFNGKLVCMDYGTILRAVDYATYGMQKVAWKALYKKNRKL